MRKWFQVHMRPEVCMGRGSEGQLATGILLHSTSERALVLHVTIPSAMIR